MPSIPLFHAVVLLDHQSARVLQFDAEQVQSEKIKAHSHHTRQHGSTVRTEHEFFAELCGALAGISEVLITGSHSAMADFQRYVKKHQSGLEAQIAGYEPVDHPSDNQLVAMARKYFVRYDRMNGVPTPT